MQPAAHIRLVDGRVEIHALEEHLRQVGRLARCFAEPFGGGTWAEPAGRWQDQYACARFEISAESTRIDSATGWT